MPSWHRRALPFRAGPIAARKPIVADARRTPRQRGDGGHLLLAQREIENRGVLGQPLDARGARDRHHALLLDMPSQHDLRRRPGVAARSLGDRRLPRTARRRETAGNRRSVAMPAVRQALITLAWSRCGWYSTSLATSGASDSGIASPSSVVVKFETPIWRVSPSSSRPVQRADRVGQRDFRVGPVDQQQVDMVEPQPLQAGLGRAAEIGRREVGPPHLGGDEDFVARHAAEARMPAPTASSLP